MTRARLNLRALDMLRGLLAVYVLAGHCRWLLWAGHSAWMAAPHARWLEPLVYASATLRYGREAVMVFFVLSGFFIHLRAAQSPDARSTAGEFYRRRAHRLGAPYALALVVTVALDLFGRSQWPGLYQAETGDPLTDLLFAKTGYTWLSIWPALVVLPSSLGYDFGTNGPLWSLGYEVVYYALYPAWLALRRRSGAAAFGVAPALLLLAGWPALPEFIATVLVLYPVWLTGAALAELLTGPRIRVPQAAAAAVFAAGLVLHVWGGLHAAPAVPAMLYGGAAVVMCAQISDRRVSLPPVRLFEYLGVRSYSIYIMHFPFVALMGAALFALGGRPLHGWYAVGGGVAAVLFGCLCFEICERHFVHHRVPGARLAA